MRWMLKEVAEKKGLTGYEIAKKTGISKQTIYKIMREPTVGIVTMKTLALLCHHLNVEAGDLLSSDTPSPKPKRKRKKRL